MVDPIDRVVPVTEPTTGIATDRLRTVIGQLTEKVQGALKTSPVKRSLAPQSSSVSTGAPGDVVGGVTALSPRSVSVGDTIECELIGAVSAGASTQVVNISASLDDGTNYDLFPGLELHSSTASAIAGFLIRLTFTVTSQSTLNGFVEVVSTTTNSASGNGSERKTLFLDGIACPDFQSPTNFEVRMYLDSGASRTATVNTAKINHISES